MESMANIPINFSMNIVTGWVLKLSLLFVIPTVQATTDFPNYKEAIDKIVLSCKQSKSPTAEAATTNAIVASSQYASCFSKKMVTEMRNMPQYRELILESALKANSKYIPEIIEAAIEAGMAPLVTLMRAIDIYPNHGEDIRRGAMSAGVDPFVVTEATSGLEN